MLRPLISMDVKLTHRSIKLVSALKWVGCVTALLFATVGLVLDIVAFEDGYQLLSRAVWMVVATAMAVGFTAAVLDRSDTMP